MIGKRYLSLMLWLVLLLPAQLLRAAECAEITVAPLTTTPGGTVQVHVSGGPANPRDWIGLYLVGGVDYVQWWYLSSGAEMVPPKGVASGTIPVEMPPPPGLYEFRFFANDSAVLLATSQPVLVEVGTPPALEHFQLDCTVNLTTGGIVCVSEPQ